MDWALESKGSVKGSSISFPRVYNSLVLDFILGGTLSSMEIV